MSLDINMEVRESGFCNYVSMYVSSAWMDQRIIFYILWIKPKILKWYESSFRLLIHDISLFT
jgi:hypothetical protein